MGMANLRRVDVVSNKLKKLQDAAVKPKSASDGLGTLLGKDGGEV